MSFKISPKQAEFLSNKNRRKSISDLESAELRDLPRLYGDLEQLTGLMKKLKKYSTNSKAIRKIDHRIDATLQVIAEKEIEAITGDNYQATAYGKKIKTEIVKTAEGFIARQS